MKISGRGGGVVATLVPFLLFQLPMVPAILLLEGGAYSAEIGQHGHPVGAIWLFLVYLMVALAAFAFIFITLPHCAPPKPRREFVWIANVSSVLMLAFYAIPLMVYGPAFLTNATRYQFLDYPYVEYFNIKLYLGIICAYHGWMLRLTKRWLYLAYFVAVLALMIGWGEKFSGPQYAVTYFVVGLALAGGDMRRIVVPLAVLVPVVLAIWALPTVLADRGDELVDAFTDRLGRQAQVFYKVVDEPPLGPNARSTLETLDYFGSYTPSANGMNYLKDQYIADSLRGVHMGSLAAGYPAIVLSGGVGIGLIVTFFLEILRFALMREVLIVGFRVQNIILWPIYLYLLNYIGKIYESGNTYLLTSPVFFGMIALIFLFHRIDGRATSLMRSNRPFLVPTSDPQS